MADFSKWGAPGGLAAFDTSQHTQALTRLAGAEATKMEEDTSNNKRMMMMMQGAGQATPAGQEGPANPADLIGKIEKVSQRLIDGGFVKQGADYAKEASLMREREATIRKDQFAEKSKMWDQKEKQLTYIHSMLAGVDGPESFEAAKRTAQRDHPGDVLPPQFDHYDPVMIDAYRNGTKEGLAKIKSDRELAKDDEGTKDKDSLIKHRKFLEEHDLRMEKIAREREDRLKKNGGAKIKAVLEPTPQGRALAQALLVEEFPDIETKIVMGKEVFSTAALAIASDAKVRMRNSEGGLSLSEATQQAFAAAKERGDLETIPGAKRDIFGGQFTEGKSVTKFVGGNSPETPMSLPTSVKDGKASVDATKLKAGRFYRRSDGAVAKWTGKGFILATPKAAASRPATPESSDDTGDEDME